MTYPTKDENLLEGASVLMERMRPDAELDTSIFERIATAAQSQINARNPSSLDDQIPPVSEANIKEIGSEP
jgi:hypothetical protein